MFDSASTSLFPVVSTIYNLGRPRYCTTKRAHSLKSASLALFSFLREWDTILQVELSNIDITV